MRPRTIWASLSPLKIRHGAARRSRHGPQSQARPDWRSREPVRLRSRRFRQRRQGAAELDHVAIAVLPVIQKLEVRENVLEGHGLQLICDRRHHVASHWLWSDNQHGRVEIARLSRNATDIDLDFGSCLDCAFQKVRRVVIGINLNSGSSQRKDAAFTNQSY